MLYKFENFEKFGLKIIPIIRNVLDKYSEL